MGIFDLRQEITDRKILAKITDTALAYWSANAPLIVNPQDEDAKEEAEKILHEFTEDPEVRDKLPDFIKMPSDIQHRILIDTAGIIITSKMFISKTKGDVKQW